MVLWMTSLSVISLIKEATFSSSFDLIAWASIIEWAVFVETEVLEGDAISAEAMLVET